MRGAGEAETGSALVDATGKRAGACSPIQRSRAAAEPGARHRRGRPQPVSQRSRPFGSGYARSVYAPRHKGPTGRDSARPLAARTIPTILGRRARRGSRPPYSRRCGRGQRSELRLGSWVISMTGAGGLSSVLQPVTAKPGRPLTLMGALRGLPAEGVGRDQRLGRRGRLSPQGSSPPGIQNVFGAPGRVTRWICSESLVHRKRGERKIGSQLAGTTTISIRQLDLMSRTPSERSFRNHHVSD